MGASAYQYLPLPAKCALDYLAAQSYGERSIAKLDKYLDHYFGVYGQQCDDQIRKSCHEIALNRYSLTGADALPAA